MTSYESCHVIISELSDMESRLDSTITFTLVRYLYTLISSYLRIFDITMMCLVIALVSVNLYKVQPHRQGNSGSQESSLVALHVMIDMVLRFDFLILSQNISDIAAKYATSTADMHASIICGRIAAGFGLLLLVAATPSQFASMSVVQRSISMLLYILTDSTSSIMQSVNIGLSPGLVGLLSMVILKKMSVDNKPTMIYVMKGVNMMIVNVFILSIVQDAYTVQEKMALLLLTVFAIDTLQGSDEILQDSRNYAVWKTAQQLHILYTVYKADPAILVALSVLIIYLQSQLLVHHTRVNSTLVELMLLMTVNEVLSSIGDVLRTMNSAGSTALLMMYIIIIYTIKRISFPTN